MRLSIRRQPNKCVCTNNPDAPSTHRGAAHFESCPHSTLRETTGGYEALRRQLDAKRDAKRQRERARTARPITRTVL